MLGLKIISAKFGEDLTTYVGRIEKKVFSVIQNGGRSCVKSMIMCHTWDVPRYHETHLIKANKSRVIGQNTCLLPAATPSDHMTPNWLDILRREFRVIIPSLVLISQGFAEIYMTQRPVWLLCCRFWLAVPEKRFWKSKIRSKCIVRVAVTMMCANSGEHWTKI